MKDEIQKKYFSTTEVAEIIHEGAGVVRTWSDFFAVGIRLRKTRMFTRNQVAKMHMIKTLVRTELYTLAGAKRKLQQIKL